MDTKFTVEFYTSASGKTPVQEFIDSQDMRMQARILRGIDRLRVEGNQLRMPYSKALSDGMFELRVQCEGNAARVFYFFVVGMRIVMTNGFMKKTQKTPQAEIEKACSYRDEYMRRNAK